MVCHGTKAQYGDLFLVLKSKQFNMLNKSPIFGFKHAIKSVEDYLLATFFVILLSPLMLFIAILIKLSSKGPVFYLQKRVSLNGKEFNMIKFRSMIDDAEQYTGAVWAKTNDARVTKIGSWLRKTGLDELPQFINVLKGEMSIVGPRPERPIFVKKFSHQIPGYMQKHLVKGGITGWAQIKGFRGNTNLEKRIQYDLYYINNWSLWLDMKIIFYTFFVCIIC